MLHLLFFVKCKNLLKTKYQKKERNFTETQKDKIEKTNYMQKPISARIGKEMVHICDTQRTEGYCDVILIKN